MKSLLIFTFIALLGIKAEARNFYEAKFKVTMWYSNLATGSTYLAKELITKVHVSDDSKFCVVIWGPGTLPCDVQFDTNYPSSSKVTFPYGTLQDMALDIGNNSTTSTPDIKTSLRRLIYTLNTPGTISYDTGFTYQFHDTEPESFHFKCSDYDEMKLI